jgi:hypothetical protein
LNADEDKAYCCGEKDELPSAGGALVIKCELAVEIIEIHFVFVASCNVCQFPI